LRKESRRTYLAKRKVDKLIELEQDVIDDEFLFDESELTEREKKERRYTWFNFFFSPHFIAFVFDFL
jgi:pre-mRNA-splicing factor ATP-dependent RNA helicase DHX16